MSRAKDLTTQLLTFSQDGDLEKTDITLDQIVRDTALFHLAGSNIKISLEKPESLWQVNADKSQISQVISNLVLNARQAMPNGGTLSIRMENTVISENDYSSFELDRYVKLTIADQGIGIPEKYFEKIFDPYFTTKQEGSGLGLAVVHSIILSHHGYIYVNSRPGEGTTFVIYLPIASGKDPVPQRLERFVATNGDIKPCRVLVMDDDPLVREVSVRMLNKLGHTVDLCKDGQSAIDLHRQAFENNTLYDLIILDLTIPGGMGAKDTIQPLLDIDPDARVIVASGYSNDPVLSDFAAYGFKATAAKPYTVDKLAHAIGQAFEN
jgi:CheY-like chemotaxis protein